MRTLLFAVPIVSLLLFTAVVHGGGWNVVTVRELPEYVVTGRPLKLTFKVWVPSEEPMTGLRPPVVHATNGHGGTFSVTSLAGPKAEEFTATLSLPTAGDWTISIDAEYPGAATMPPITAIGPDSPMPQPGSLASRGARLFTVKGCNGCHMHPDIKDGRFYGPELPDKRFSAEFLRRFLADPSIVPEPGEICRKDHAICGSPYAMPNLNLKNEEIEALVAFLTKTKD
jgi:hypothetical protein